MTAPRLLLPLRVPELGPHLGKLVVGTGRTPGGFDLDQARYGLVTRIVRCAGEARRLAARGDRASAVATLGRTAWLEAWEEAVAGVGELLVERINAHLAREASAVHMPARLLRRVLLNAPDVRALTARLGSAGAGLVPVLDELEARATQALDATPLERAAVEGWQEALKLAARRLEAAWLALEDLIEAEVARWRDRADQVAAWRRPLWPVVLVGGLALAGGVWLGLVLGGFLTAPTWLVGGWQAVSGW